MKLLDQLQRRFGHFALPHVTEGLIACQVLAFFLEKMQPAFLANISLVPARVMHGEVWRLVTFLCQPPLTNPLFAFFFWYLFYLMGTALESTWGVLRYNVYLLVGWAATVAASFVQPDAPASPGFLQGSVFLAFAYLYPNFQLLLFFLLPVKVKWLALLQWIFIFSVIAFDDLASQLLATASVLNFLLFFWHDIVLRVRSGHWRMAHQTRQIRSANVPRHTCFVCGVTSLSDPKMIFRYCSKCAGAPCYCDTRISSHEHVIAAASDGDSVSSPAGQH